MNEYVKKVIIALDTIDLEKINFLFNELNGIVEIVKIGFQSFIYFGPAIIKKANDYGFKVFLDLKLHDIPNTIEKAIESCIKHNVHMVTLHISGGKEMIQKAVAIKNHYKSNIKLLGVTVLTSFDENTFQELNFKYPLKEMVNYFAKLGYDSELDGIICSPQEIKNLRKEVGSKMLIITPGIRITRNNDDQKRTMTPKEAFSAGADYIVIGRPILQSENPRDFLKNI